VYARVVELMGECTCGEEREEREKEKEQRF